jgi:hypothetical protein
MLINKDIFISSVVRPFSDVIDSIKSPLTYAGWITSFDGTYMTITVDNVKTKKDLKFVLNAFKDSFIGTPRVYEHEGFSY